jgi:hypothetical protein
LHAARSVSMVHGVQVDSMDATPDIDRPCQARTPLESRE